MDQHPKLADQIRNVFPPLLIMDRASPDTGPAVSGDRTLQIPDRIGDYQIVRKIGQGGMGVVYEAKQESLGRLVAKTFMDECNLQRHAII